MQATASGGREAVPALDPNTPAATAAAPSPTTQASAPGPQRLKPLAVQYSGVIVQGTDGPDNLQGGKGDDQLFGGKGDDRLTGFGGDDLLDGGAGIDTAVFGGPRAAFLIATSRNGPGYLVTDTRAGGSGTDTLIDVERVSFSDGTWALNGQNLAPEVAYPLPDRVMPESSSGSFQVNGNAFVDPERQALHLSASLADGSALPAWLQFDSATGRFSGTPPAGVADLELRVTATDGGGLSISDYFQLMTRTEPGSGQPGLVVRGTANDDVLGGGKGDDWLSGGKGHDALSGAHGADVLHGGNGIDLLVGGPGNDWLHGDADVDTAEYAGMRAEYQVSREGDHYLVTDRVAGRDGVDRLFDIEQLRFADGVWPVIADNTPPVLRHALPAQQWIEDWLVEAYLPFEAFADAESPLSFSVTLGDGSPLPSWMSLYPSGRLLGTVPAHTPDLQLRITATDLDGASVSGTLLIQTPPDIGGRQISSRLYIGNGLDNSLGGGKSDDRFVGNAGNDSLNGGGGWDTVVFSGPRSDYSIQYDRATQRGTVVDNVAGRDGSDALADVERLQFSDGVYPAVPDDKAPALAKPLPDLEAAEGQAFEFLLPRGSFVDTDDSTLLYSIRLGNGDAVPGWLYLDPGTGRLSSSQVPLNAPDLRLRITATDPWGLSASDDFLISTTHMVLVGSAGQDRLIAGPGNDTLSAGKGDDSLEGMGGNDSLNGGEGKDTALYNGPLRDYLIQYDAMTRQLTLTDLVAGRDGSDTLVDVELLRFSDQTCSVSDFTQTQASVLVGLPPPVTTEPLYGL